MKKLFSIVLVALLMVSLFVPSFAAEDNGVITIKNAVPEEEYSIYRIFDLDSYDKDDNAYVYKLNSDWVGFEKEVSQYFSVNDKTGEIKWNDEIDKNDITDIQIFVRKALAFASSNNIQPVESKVAPDSDSKSVELVFNVDTLGYYLIDSNFGILCSLDTTDPNVGIEEKNEPVMLVKHIIDSNGLVCHDSTFSVGDDINFEIDIEIGKGKTKEVVVHDRMSQGLDLIWESIVVSINDDIIDLTKYDVFEETGGDCSFEVVFNTEDNPVKNEFGETKRVKGFILSEGDVINIKYQTRVTSEYKSEYGLNNMAWVTGNNAEPVVDDDPPGDFTETPMLKIQIIKTEKNNIKGVYNILNGAAFSLYREENSKTPVEFKKMGNGVYRLVEEGYKGKTVTKIPGGCPIIEGISGVYWLEEVTAPEGYKPMQGRLKINVTEDNLAGKAAIKNGKYDSNIPGGIHIMNEKAPDTPLTGSVGTIVIYSIGGILLVLGCVFLIVLVKRKDNNK